MKRLFILMPVIFVSLLSGIEVSGKPALNEENRNLCESDPDKAECIREVEEAKASPGINEDQQEDESADKQEESNSQVDSMEEHLEMLDRVRRESEENRKFWKDELRSMNKWEKYGLG